MEESESSSAARIKALESELQGVSDSFVDVRRVALEWETTFNASRDAFWILDKTHHVLRSNRAAETIFQKPIDTMIGRLCCEIVHGTSCPIPQCPMLRARTTLQRETMELVVDDRCYQISIDPILDGEGRFDGAVHVVSDITERKRTEAALQQSEAMYRDLVENSSVLICTHDLDGRVWSANKRAAQSLGYPDFDISRIASLNIYIQDLLLPEAKDLFPLYIESLKTKGVATGEMAVLDAQGNRRIWEYNNSLRTEGVERPIVRGIAHDITEKRAAEKELKRRLVYERLLSEISTLAVRVEELSDDDWLPPFLEASLEIIGQTINVSRTYLFEHCHHSDTMTNTYEWCAEGISAQKEHLRDISASSIQWWMETMFREGKICIEHIQDIPDETIRSKLEVQGIVSILAVPLFVEGRYFGFLGFDECSSRRKWPAEDVELLLSISRIITGVIERRRNEEALRESELRFRRIYEESPIAYQSLDTDGRILDVNPAWLKLFGYDREEVIGEFLWEFFAPESRKAFESNFPRFRQRGATHGMERKFVHKDGRILTVVFDGVWVRDKLGNPVYTHCVLHDITERIKAEEEQGKLREQLFHAQKLESVGRLAGGVAHDFNNMLAVIIGRAELALVKAGGPQSPIGSDIQDILHAAQRSADLTRQLLAFARRQTAKPKVLDLNDIITEMLKMIRRLIGEDMRLTWIPGANLWPVKIDPAQVDQILANLCVNARDAKHPEKETGAIQLETRKVRIDESYCSVKAECTPGDYVMLAVSDDGIGMDRETLSLVFEPFFTTKEVGKGTGLGLSTVFGIVKQNGGFINVYSEPGQGTTFKIYLPRIQQETPDAEAAQEPAIRLEGTETVLIVEDEEIVLGLAKQILDHYGYRVLAANRPGEALELARAHKERIDLLVTDVVMPEMNGKQLEHLIAEIHPEIRVLFMSGYTSNVIQQKGILDEGVHFIQKPFSVKGFAEKVRTVLG